MAEQSFTQQLVASDPESYKRATQSPFLAAAARGQVSKDILGKWLANDRLYIHNYISGTGRILATHQLPATAAENAGSSLVKLVDWLTEALVNVRREEKFFIDTASRYGITVDLPTSADGRVSDGAKLEGLRRFEVLFSSFSPQSSDILPWLETAIVFWGTERCYLDAWTWAKSQLHGDGDANGDADGGALRQEFIPNWSSPEFATFVGSLEKIIDESVDELVKVCGGDIWDTLFGRAQGKWRELLVAEEAFWPPM